MALGEKRLLPPPRPQVARQGDLLDLRCGVLLGLLAICAVVRDAAPRRLGKDSAMTFFVIPTDIYDEITKRLDAAIAEYPDAEKDRAELRSQIVAFVDEHGYVPEFGLQPKVQS